MANMHPCGTCRAATDVPCADWCPDGMSERQSRELSSAIVALGHSIAAFCRRAEVEELRHGAIVAALIAIRYSGSDVGDGALRRLNDRVSRLAALALAGGSEGE